MYLLSQINPTVTFCLLNTHFSDILPNQYKDCILLTHLDECSQQADAPKIEWLNMRLPKDGTVMCRNT